jgi:hypothetical protein
MLANQFNVYNFIKRHKTLRIAPAVAAGIISQPMKLEELLALFDDFRAQWFLVSRPLHYRPLSKRQTFEPQTPLSPWYLDPESVGRCPPMDQRNCLRG